ncbi:MAG: hypothetical protein Q8R37_01885 [Nanoarchaeota archaeon]|nr:hypothetical protein [Nanoarchaeota archaeon]
MIVKRHSTLCSIIAALTFSVSSPAGAQDVVKPDVPPISHTMTSTPATRLHYLNVPEQPLPYLLDNLDFLEKVQTAPGIHRRLIDKVLELTELPSLLEKKENSDGEDQLLHSKAGSSITVRFELPKSVHYRFFGRRFELDDDDDTRCYFKSGDVYCAYDDAITGSKMWIDVVPTLQLNTKDFLNNFSLGGVYGRTFYNNIRNDFPQLIAEGGDLVDDLWEKINQIIENKEVELALTYAGFFRDLLPQYTKDGVIDPGEADKIKDAIYQKLKTHYQNLDGNDQHAVDDAVDIFIRNFNNFGNQHVSIQNIRAAGITKNNFLDKLKYGSLSFRSWYNVFTNFESLYTLQLHDNEFLLRSDVSSRFRSSSDRFTEFSFDNKIFRQGFLSFTEGIGEAHLQLNGEIHGGVPLRDFFDQQYQADFDTLEFLLGYQPVLIDGTLQGNVHGFLDLKTFYIHGYELQVHQGKKTVGVGFSQGYAYYLHSHGRIDLSASADSFNNRIEGDLHGDLTILEKWGKYSSFYFLSQEEKGDYWYYAAAGVAIENLRALERKWIGRFQFKYDYEFNGSYEQFWDEQILIYPETILTPLAAVRVGIDYHFINPFLFGTTAGFGAGLFLNTSFVTSELELGTKGYASLRSLLSPDGNLNLKTNHDYYRQRQQIVDSLFPAKKAMFKELQQSYWSSLDGFFIETNLQWKIEEHFPHDPPRLLEIGLLGAVNPYYYFRLGGMTSFDQRLRGMYGTLGNKYFTAHFSINEEVITERKNHATTIETSLAASFGNHHLMAAAYLYPERLNYFLNPQDDEGDIVFNLTYESSNDFLEKAFSVTAYGLHWFLDWVYTEIKKSDKKNVGKY